MNTLTKAQRTATHNITAGYCTICNEDQEWIEQTKINCRRLVCADEVKPGDYMLTTNNGGRQGSTIAIGNVSRDGDWVILHTALTAFRIPAHDNVYLA